MADPRIVIDGKDYPFPLNLTLGEEAEIERITGQGYDMTKPGALGFLALAYIAVKRIDSTVRLEDLELLGPNSFDVQEGDVEEPTSPLPEDASNES